MHNFDRFLLSVVYDIPNMVFVVDVADTTIIYANDFTKQKLGTQCVGRKFSEQFQGAGADHFFVSYNWPAQRDDATGKADYCPQSEYYDDDSEDWYHVLQRPISWIDDSSKMVFVLNEINSLKRLQKDLSEAHAALAIKNRELHIAAKTDRLTQLYNRHHLDAVIDAELKRFERMGTCFSILLADCDKFKSVNDTFGHQAGDLVLIDIAHLMGGAARAIDTVGRWGGEEFLAILPGTDLAGAVEVAEKLRAAIAAHQFAGVGHKTASFGVAEIRPGDSIRALVARADAALYRAKKNGRNRVEAGT